jgi:hypothetical protein
MSKTFPSVYRAGYGGTAWTHGHQTRRKAFGSFISLQPTR